MPFDGTAWQPQEPYRRKRPTSLNVRSALRGWRPIRHHERIWRRGRQALMSVLLPWLRSR